MSRVETRTSTRTRHEYLVPLGAARSDYYRAALMADQALEAAGREHHADDAFRVTADDDHIIIYWEEEAE